MYVEKVLEGKLTGTPVYCKVQPVSFVSLPYPPPLLESLPKIIHYFKNRSKYFSQYCLAMQMFVLLTVLHLHFSANVVADKCFLFIFSLVWGM